MLIFLDIGYINGKILINKKIGGTDMGEKTDYTTYFSEEIQKFAKDAVTKDARWMAVIVKAMYEKYGREAIDVLNDRRTTGRPNLGRRFQS